MKYVAIYHPETFLFENNIRIEEGDEIPENSTEVLIDKFYLKPIYNIDLNQWSESASIEEIQEYEHDISIENLISKKNALKSELISLLQQIEELKN